MKDSYRGVIHIQNIRTCLGIFRQQNVQISTDVLLISGINAVHLWNCTEQALRKLELNRIYKRFPIKEI
jgi:hypothetical protein